MRSADASREAAKHAEAEQLTCMWAQYGKVDCGDCVLSFRPLELGAWHSEDEVGLGDFSNLSHLVIRSRWRLNFNREAARKQLRSALRRVLDSDTPFVATLDFRGYGSEATKGGCEAGWAKDLRDFCAKHSAEWNRSLQAAAVLMEARLFEVAARGSVGAFCQAALAPSPFVICHSESVAAEYFRATLDGDEALASIMPVPPSMIACPPEYRPPSPLDFVAIAGVFEVPTARKSRGGTRTTAIASLKPLLPPQLEGLVAPGTPPQDVEAPSVQVRPVYNVLPNGDVRVVQSPARDVLLMPRADTVAAEAMKAVADSTISALKFECAAATLQLLVGAHLHLGELMIDAEVESMRREHARGLELHSDPMLETLWAHIARQCFAGVHKLVQASFFQCCAGKALTQ